MIDPVELLEGLLASYSPTGQEAGAVSYLTSAMRSLGFSTGIDPAGNAVGWRGEGPREILLLGHIDTVPGLVPLRREDDLLFGRGSVDAKGPLSAFTAAAARISLKPGWKVRVVGAVGEEGDSSGARWLCSNSPAPSMVVIGEPSGWSHLTLGYKGSAWLDYSLSRPQAHTAGQTRSACEEAVTFWNRLEKAAREYNTSRLRLFDQLTPTLRKMESGSDGLSETARLKVGLRLPEGLNREGLETFLTPLAGDGFVRLDSFTPAYRAEKNTSLVRAFLKAVRTAEGKPGFTFKTGTSDMNMAGPQWNCPILAYGPGDSSLDHTPNEHISIDEYLRAIEVLGLALEDLMAA